MEALSSPFLQFQTLTLSGRPFQSKSTTIRIKVQCESKSLDSSVGETILYASKTTQKTTGDYRMTRSPLNAFLNSFDDFICRHIDPALHPSVDPKIVLAGNFAPVSELPPTACEVTEGSLPPCLDGAYIRNGPNPQFTPQGPHHHFDGDGMLHCVRISAGQPTFCSRFVETYKYAVEREIGSPMVIKMLSAFTNLPASLARVATAVVRAASGMYDFRRGIGVANTSVACFGGKLFALGESGLPYMIKVTPDGDVITLGSYEGYGGPQERITAHTKVDRETGEAFAFRSNMRRPFVTYFRIGPDGAMQSEVDIFSMNEASLIHDFAITKNYVVIPDPQMVIRPAEIMKGMQPVLVDHKKMPKLGVIPRYAVDDKEMWWVEVPGFNIMHAVNAWEEDDGATIVMVAPNLLPVEHVFQRAELVSSIMERVEINLKTKTARRRTISAARLDFGVINPAYAGKKTRYMYVGIMSSGIKMSGVAKVDLSLCNSSSGDCVIASRLYGPGCYGGESYFVPRESNNPEADEDDGYLLNYVYNEHTQESMFVVIDAKSRNLDIVAVVKLPQRVPYGFHGMFVADSDLRKL